MLSEVQYGETGRRLQGRVLVFLQAVIVFPELVLLVIEILGMVSAYISSFLYFLGEILNCNYLILRIFRYC